MIFQTHFYHSCMQFKCQNIYFFTVHGMQKDKFVFLICSSLFQNEEESISNTYKHSYTNYKWTNCNCWRIQMRNIHIITEICQLKKKIFFKRTIPRTQTIFNQNAFRLERRASDKNHFIPKKNYHLLFSFVFFSLCIFSCSRLCSSGTLNFEYQYVYLVVVSYSFLFLSFKVNRGRIRKRTEFQYSMLKVYLSYFLFLLYLIQTIDSFKMLHFFFSFFHSNSIPQTKLRLKHSIWENAQMKMLRKHSIRFKQNNFFRFIQFRPIS